MNDSPTEPSEPSRAIAYYSTEYILRYMLDIGALFDQDYEKMVIYLTIASSNVQTLMNSAEKFEPYGSLNVIIPAELQRPMTRSAVTRATGLPRETVRRKVAAMIDSGMLISDTRGGIRLMPGSLGEGGSAVALAKNEVNVRRLIRQVSALT